MKRNILFFTILSALYSCHNPQPAGEGVRIVFDPAHATTWTFDRVCRLRRMTTIDLEMTQNSLITPYFSVSEDDSSYYVFQRYASDPVCRFGREGRFMGHIGEIGNGPGEYVQVQDVQICYPQKEIYVLDARSRICVYDSVGSFKCQKDLDIPSSFSFAIDSRGSCWFGVGNNRVFGKEVVYRVDSGRQVTKYLPQESNLLPVQEPNFACSSNGYVTYRQSLYNQLYRIEGEDMVPSYFVDFGKYTLPSSFYRTQPSRILEELNNRNYGLIRSYLENDMYVYLVLTTVESQEDSPKTYHWVLNKKNRKESCFQLLEEIPESCFIRYPQYLDSSDNVVFIGYDVAESDGETDKNPSIFKIGAADMF